jgi:hypothetical protein
MKPIAINVFHVVYETDFDDFHNWSLEGWSTGHNDESTIMAKAQSCVAGLVAAGIPADVVVYTRRVGFPKHL